MCTSIVVNRNKTIVGWNLDILNINHRVRTGKKGVYIEVYIEKEGWLPLFGANSRGDFVGMPTCWPFDSRSEPSEDDENIIMLDIDMLLQKKTLEEIKTIVENRPVHSIAGVTFMASLSDKNGNVLHVVPGQGYQYFEKPEYKIMTNFSPFKQDSETHPRMGWDRYKKAESMIQSTSNEFSVKDCFSILRAVSQEICPTVVSMVFDVDDKTVFWCEQRHWGDIKAYRFCESTDN